MTVFFRWKTPCGFAVQLTDASWKQMEHECARAGTVETGGILVGHYTADASTAIITDALPPTPDSWRSARCFHRGVSGLRDLLATRWREKRRTYYVGEWHYHPASIVEPSSADLRQMDCINSDPRYKCKEPIMLIIGQAWSGVEIPVRVFVFPRGEQRMEFDRINRGSSFHPTNESMRRQATESRTSFKIPKSNCR